MHWNFVISWHNYIKGHCFFSACIRYQISKSRYSGMFIWLDGIMITYFSVILIWSLNYTHLVSSFTSSFSIVCLGFIVMPQDVCLYLEFLHCCALWNCFISLLCDEKWFIDDLKYDFIYLLDIFFLQIYKYYVKQQILNTVFFSCFYFFSLLRPYLLTYLNFDWFKSLGSSPFV